MRREQPSTINKKQNGKMKKDWQEIKTTKISAYL